MELINPHDYDISYDKQFMSLMIRLFKPYIIFKKSSDDKVPKIYRNIGLHWESSIDTSPPYTFHGKIQEHGMKIISLEEYIHFVQCIFPNIINDEIKNNQHDLDIEVCKQDIINSQRKTLPRFKLPMFINLDNIEEEECNQIVSELNQLDRQNITIIRRQNRIKLKELQEKKNNLEEIQRIYKEKNGSINNIIDFLKNLNLIGL